METKTYIVIQGTFNRKGKPNTKIGDKIELSDELAKKFSNKIATPEEYEILVNNNKQRKFLDPDLLAEIERLSAENIELKKRIVYLENEKKATKKVIKKQ